MIHLITPEEAEKAKISSIPNYVFQAFNELLAENFYDVGTIIYQHEALKRILSLYPSIIENDKDNIVNSLFVNRWLDIEKFYERLVGKLLFINHPIMRILIHIINLYQRKNESK